MRLISVNQRENLRFREVLTNSIEALTLLLLESNLFGNISNRISLI